MPDPFCEAPDDALLRRYLLDSTNEEERYLVERFLFEDTAGLERIRAASADLGCGGVPFSQWEWALASFAEQALSESMAERLLEHFRVKYRSRWELPFYDQIAAGTPIRAPERGLTPAELEVLLARLAPDRDQAGALYEDIRRRLVWLFSWRLGGDAESLADEAMDRVARRVADGTTFFRENLFGYFWSVARHVAQEMVRKRQREDRTFGAFSALYTPDWPEPLPDVDPRLACLQKCLGRLRADQRHLVLRYHDEDDPISGRRRLAHELGIGLNALRIRAHRARRKLEDCCTRCLAKSTGGPEVARGAPEGEL